MPRKKKAVRKKAVKPVEKQEEKGIYYVGIKEPVELKNSLQESAKDLMQYLERFEKIKNTREKKKAEMEHLKRIFAEITKDTNKLKRLLPRTKLRIDIHKKEKPKKLKKTEKVLRAQKKEMPKMPKPPAKEEPHDEELAKLEAELAAIEGRLSKLS